MNAMSPWQFTIFRLAFGLFLAGFFALGPALPWPPTPVGGALLRGVLAALSLSFAAGFVRRPAAGLLALAWAVGVLPAALPEQPLWLAPGLLLILSLLAPEGEPGSRRAPPAEGWRLPPVLFGAAWIGLVAINGWVSFNRSGGTAMPVGHGPGALPLFFALLALMPKDRRWAWLGLLVCTLTLPPVSWVTAGGMLMLYLFTFDPRWLPPVAGRDGRLLLAFDGDCMICSRTLRFLATEDRADLLRFVKLQSTLGREMEATAGSGSLQTMLVKAEGRILTRSAGVLRVLAALGGHWRVLGWAGRLIPRPLADALYNFIAVHRYRWFGRTDVCAMPSPELRARLMDGDAAE